MWYFGTDGTIRHNQLCMDVWEGNKPYIPNVSVSLFLCNGNPNQRWVLQGSGQESVKCLAFKPPTPSASAMLPARTNVWGRVL